MINQSKPTTSLTNADKVATGETWGNITSSWSSETRTWLEIGSFITNASKVSSSIVNQAKP